MRRWLILWLVVLSLPIAPVVLGRGSYPQQSDTLINDYAALLTAEDAAAVRTMLSDLQVAHGIEAVVVTIDSIGDYETGDTTIESFATGLFNTWGIGDATKNDGVLLLIAVGDRKVRIELGSGYGSGHSSEMQAVIDRYILPRFRTNAYSTGIRLGTQAMIAKLTDQLMPETGESTASPAAVPAPVKPSYTSPNISRRSADSAFGILILIVMVVVMGVVAAIRSGLGGGYSGSDSSSGWGSSLDSSDSSSDSSYSSSDSSSSSSSSDSGGSSSGGGASGSW